MNTIQKEFLIEFNALLKRYQASIMINRNIECDYISIDFYQQSDDNNLISEISLSDYYCPE